MNGQRWDSVSGGQHQVAANIDWSDHPIKADEGGCVCGGWGVGVATPIVDTASITLMQPNKWRRSID